MSTSEPATQQQSDVNRSFEWGQLFAGSLIGGLAVWKLLHKVTETEPSEWFSGLSSAYEEVRDFLMTPFSWIDLGLTADDKDLLTVCLVAVGAAVRTSIRFPHFMLLVLAILAGGSGLQAMGWWGDWGPWNAIISDPAAPLLLVVHVWVAVGSYLLIWTLLGVPVVLVMRELVMRQGRTEYWFMLTSVLFTVGWGTILLLLNWAAS